LTLAKCIAQKPLGTKIVLHLLLPEPEVLANEEGNMRGDILGRHVDGCFYQQTNQSALKEKPQTQKKEIRLHR
jgi:hypothetical protein